MYAKSWKIRYDSAGIAVQNSKNRSVVRKIKEKWYDAPGKGVQKLCTGNILTPVGMILGSFLGAFFAELYYNRQGAVQALKAAFGSFLGFITGTGLKTIVACLILWKIFVFAF